MKPQNVIILWGVVTSFFLAAVRSLSRELDGDFEITVVASDPNSWYPELLDKYDLVNVSFVSYDSFNVRKKLKYDLMIITSWNFKKYRKFARLNSQTCTIMTMDNQFRRTPKQIALLSSVFGPIYIRKLMQFAFVGGLRQSKYAQMLGFTKERIISGAFSYDDQIFRPEAAAIRINQFCFIGRKVAVKGLDTLLSGYEIYRVLCAQENVLPWDLVIAGPGALPRKTPFGVLERSYLFPEEAAELMASSKCFVLPSNFEPFGVVITEAAATGCLIIASDAVGAADHMVIEGVNGFIFPVNDSRGLAQALLEMTKFSDQQFIDGEVASKKLAKGFSPDTWTKKVLGAYQLSKSK